MSVHVPEWALSGLEAGPLDTFFPPGSLRIAQLHAFLQMSICTLAPCALRSPSGCHPGSGVALGLSTLQLFCFFLFIPCPSLIGPSGDMKVLGLGAGCGDSLRTWACD